MNREETRDLGARVAELVERIAETDAAIHELGTPHPVVTGPVAELIALGPPAVPAVLERLPAASPRMLAHLVLVLGEIGDPLALDPLRELCSECEHQPAGDPWERSVIHECRRAIRRLEGEGP